MIAQAALGVGALSDGRFAYLCIIPIQLGQVEQLSRASGILMDYSGHDPVTSVRFSG